MILRALVLLLALAGPAIGATYYVDPDTGNNALNGTSSSTPWETIPGTRNAGDTAYKATIYEAGASDITMANKIACGDTILLKGGATHESTHGGGWIIDNDFYANNCTSENRIHIRVATSAEWAGSTGHFTFDGTGITGTYARTSGKGFPDRPALIYHAAVNYIELGGVSASQRLVMQDSTSYCFTSLCNNCELAHIGLKFQWWEVKNSTGGVTVGGLQGSLLADGIAHDISGQGGLNVGSNSFQGSVEFFGIERVEIYRTGSRVNSNGDEDGFFATDAYSLWALGLDVHENSQRGVNTGSLNDADTTDFIFRFRNLKAWNNGESCSLIPNGGCTGPNTPDQCCEGPGTGHCVPYCAGAGFDISGDSQVGLSGQARNVILGGQFVRNDELGTTAYGDGHLEIWHGTYLGNSQDRTDLGDWGHDGSGNEQRLYNSLFQRRSSPGRRAINSSGDSGGPTSGQDTLPVMDYNLFLPALADTETLSGFDFSPCSSGNQTGTSRTYAGTAPCFLGANSKRGTGFTANFTSTSNCDTELSAYPTATCDLSLTSGSSAIDSGKCFFTAGDTSSGTTISSLTAGGGYTDPRMYFIAPWNATSPDMGMYLDSVGDRIVIGDDVVTITSMDASSISFTPGISWTSGDCIHLEEFTGSNAIPEIGAFGFDADGTTTTAPTPPTTSTTATTPTTLTTPPTTTTLPPSTPLEGMSLWGCQSLSAETCDPVPTGIAIPDGPVELGVKFWSAESGYIMGLRFYKHAENTGVHVGNLWSTSGTLLARAPFTNERASGWQEVPFVPPVPIQANTIYIASYHAPVGYYAITPGFFSSQGVYTPPLVAPDSAAVGGNGVYKYGESSSFPDETWNASNYWVDVLFDDEASPPTTTSTTASSPTSTTATVMTTTSSTSTTTDTPTTPTTSTTAPPTADLGLDPTIFLTQYQVASVLGPFYAIVPATTGQFPFNSDVTPTLLPCTVQNLDIHLSVSVAPGRRPAYGLLTIRFYRPDGTLLTSRGYARSAPRFDHLEVTLPAWPEGVWEASFTALSSVSPLRTSLFQPGDFGSNSPVRMEMTVAPFADAGYTEPLEDPNPADNVLNLWVERSC